jgi:Phosphoribosyl-AMP cyclohydrolase
MNAQTLAQSLSEGRTVFWSRSRSEVWRKGDTSGDRQFIRSAHYDCDGDTLLFVVEQEGKGACHTGERSCFYRAFGSGPLASGDASASDANLAMAPVWSLDNSSMGASKGTSKGALA